MIYWQLLLVYLKIGIFGFGGGYAMIALIEKEFVENKKWLEHDEFLDIVAIAESTPGPIAINSATYIGYKVVGVLGSVFATMAVCIPSFVIIYIISLFFDAFLGLQYVGYAFKGIQVCVAYLIMSAGYKMIKKMDKKPFNIIMFFLATVTVVVTTLLAAKISSILLILAGAVTGVAVYLIKSISKKEAENK